MTWDDEISLLIRTLETALRESEELDALEAEHATPEAP